jgi:hypothetical protein
MLRYWGAILAMMPLSVSSSAYSQTREQQVADFFTGYCVHALENFATVRAAAKVFDWKELPPEMLKMGAPIDPTAVTEGWSVKTKSGIQMILALSTSPKGTGCTVGSLDFEPTEMEQEITRMANGVHPDKEDTFGQRELYWNTIYNGSSVIIRLITSMTDNESGGLLSAATLRGK